MNILVNDGLSVAGINALEKADFKVFNIKVAQAQLADYINTNSIEIILIRSATKIRKELIDQCPQLQLIGRGGVGLDNIDVAYAEKKGIKVINTPNASSRSVAEMVFAHIFSSVRFLKNTNQDMPLEGDSRFKELKKSYRNATELYGKTLGIIGFGRIGKEVAKIALSLGMKVIACDTEVGKIDIKISFFDGQQVSLAVATAPLKEVLKNSDVISVHVPEQDNYLIGKKRVRAYEAKCRDH